MNTVLQILSVTYSAARHPGAAKPAFSKWANDLIADSLKNTDLCEPVRPSLARDERVSIAQRALVSLGLLSPRGNRDSKGEPDGKLGERTLEAIYDFRTLAGSGETFEGLTQKDIDCMIELLVKGPEQMPVEPSAGFVDSETAFLTLSDAVPPKTTGEKLEELRLSAPIPYLLARDERVAFIQQQLIDQGFLSLQGNQDASGAPDGKAGNRTFEGIIKLRQANGIEDITKQITQRDVDLLAGRVSVADTAAPETEAAPVAADTVEPPEIGDKLPVSAVPEMIAPAEENVLEEEIARYVKAADRAVRYVEMPSLVLSAVSGAFVIDTSRPVGERSVMLMAKETYLADYYRNSGDLQKALNTYAKISRMFTRPSRGKITNIGEYPGREVERLAEMYINNAYLQYAKIVQSINEADSQKDPSGNA